VNRRLVVGSCGAEQFEPKYTVVGVSGGDAALREEVVFGPGTSEGSTISCQCRGSFHERRFDGMDFRCFWEAAEQF
jgi:hypothetical protein